MVEEMALLPLSSGYIERASDSLPKQGSHEPWKAPQNYLLDMLMLRFGEVDDGTMELDTTPPRRTDEAVGRRDARA